MNSPPPLDNPYAAPSAPVADAPALPDAAPPLWNPGAAASWSLLFSPAFGAFLQMRNWQALGDEKNARVSWTWFVASLVLIIGIVGVSIFLPEDHPFQKFSDRFGLILLLVWYFSHGKQQMAVVKERFGKAYPRRGWSVPLAIGVASVVAFLLAIAAVGFVIGATGA
jgi:hypothetical protein